jgi:hypothetical protein
VIVNINILYYIIMKTFLTILIFIIISIIFLLFLAPFIDHFFYLEHKLEEIDEYEIFMMIIIHIVVLGILVYFYHYYIVAPYISYFKLNKTYIKIIDLILALTLTGIQRNLVFKITYLSNKHPIRDELIV